MMQGDDIRNMRQQAERLSAAENHADTQNFSALALWVIAEQLYEIRALFGIVVDSDRKEINILVNGGSVEATKG